MKKGFSKILILVIALAVVAGGFFAWQWFGVPREISKNNIAITYTSENYAWGEQIQRIEVLKDGEITYSGKSRSKKEESRRKLSETELKEISDFIVSNGFLNLPDDLTNQSCADAPTEYLEITVGEKTHRAGGNCVENETFRVIVEKLEGIVKNKINKEETAGWKTYQDEQHKVEFKYSENYINSGFASGKSPELIILSRLSSKINEGGCYNPYPDYPKWGIENKEIVKLNNIEFCLTKTEDAGMGSVFPTYYYTTKKDSNYFVVKFETSMVGNCDNYSDLARQNDCKEFYKNIDKAIKKPIENIVSTFRFLE